MSSPDIASQNFIVFADQLIIEMRQQYCKVKITRPSYAWGRGGGGGGNEGG